MTHWNERWAKSSSSVADFGSDHSGLVRSMVPRGVLYRARTAASKAPAQTPPSAPAQSPAQSPEPCAIRAWCEELEAWGRSDRRSTGLPCCPQVLMRRPIVEMCHAAPRGLKKAESLT